MIQYIYKTYNYIKLLYTGLEGIVISNSNTENIILKNMDDDYNTIIKLNEYFFRPIKPGNYKIIYKNITKIFYIPKNKRYKIFYNENLDNNFKLSKNIKNNSFNTKNKCTIL